MTFERMRQRFMQDPNFFPTNLPSPIDPRAKLSEAGVHSRSYAGISGTVDLGAFSIVVSGGYVDDDDQGNFLRYTGTGGQPDSFSGHSAQVADQSFDHRDNRTLQKQKGPFASSAVRGRVHTPLTKGRSGIPSSTLGFLTKMHLCTDTGSTAYLDKGVDGFAVCKFDLRRVEGQSPIRKSILPRPSRRKQRSSYGSTINL
ncbi:hypothetical protein H0H92_005334 [Tricholoma furcatifolium]|nr:hypothetical protein H0H92_005334 [Tricholoma furcatifolium]